MTVGLGFAVLLSACGSEGVIAPSEPAAEVSTVPEPNPVFPSPVIEGDTPDERFEAWLATGGPEFELYAHWVVGDLPGQAPPPHASEDELRELFDGWVEANTVLVRDAWNHAQDKRAQADLRNAMAVALVFFLDAQSFVGLTPEEAGSIDPDLVFDTGRTLFGVISIREVAASRVLLTTESASGSVFCIARSTKHDGSESFGTVDAADASECTGGWPD